MAPVAPAQRRCVAFPRVNAVDTAASSRYWIIRGLCAENLLTSAEGIYTPLSWLSWEWCEPMLRSHPVSPAMSRIAEIYLHEKSKSGRKSGATFGVVCTSVCHDVGKSWFNRTEGQRSNNPLSDLMTSGGPSAYLGVPASSHVSNISLTESEAPWISTSTGFDQYLGMTNCALQRLSWESQRRLHHCALRTLNDGPTLQLVSQLARALVAWQYLREMNIPRRLNPFAMEPMKKTWSYPSLEWAGVVPYPCHMKIGGLLSLHFGCVHIFLERVDRMQWSPRSDFGLDHGSASNLIKYSHRNG